MDEFPDWWRGERAPEAYDGPRPVLKGPMLSLDLGQLPENNVGLREIRFFRAQVRGLEVSLTDASLHVKWSQFDAWRFHQRVRPVCNAAGYAAQGSLGSSPDNVGWRFNFPLERQHFPAGYAPTSRF